MHTVLECELELKLVLPTGHRMHVPARFSYRTDDPYAVHIVFHFGSGRPVRWTFARELLVEGVFRPCGLGDVRMWPAKAESRNVLCIALTSPHGEALLEAPAPAVCTWTERTLRMVPPGGERELLGFDEGLSGLLSPACPAPADETDRADGVSGADGADGADA